MHKSPWFGPHNCMKLGTVESTCDPSTQKVEGRGSRVQSPPPLHTYSVKTHPGATRQPVSKINNKTKHKTKTKGGEERERKRERERERLRDPPSKHKGSEEPAGKEVTKQNHGWEKGSRSRIQKVRRHP